MLIDDWMPVYDAVERHERAVASPGAMVYAALWRTDFAASGVVRWLLALRGLGKPRSLTLASLTESGFVKLGDRPPHEVVLGVAGKFWTPSGGRVRLDAEAFRRFERPGYATAGSNFTVGDPPCGSARLAAEARIPSGAARARRCLRPSWRALRLGSGLIRLR